jgi:3-phosphoglycerate kinase
MSMNKLALKDVDVTDKRVLIRVDFNVPQDKKDPSIITNTARCAPSTAAHGAHGAGEMTKPMSRPWQH